MKIIDDATIRDLLGFTDPRGVLSFYVEHTSPRRADPQPTEPLEIRDRIDRLTRELGARDPALARAVEQRLERSGEAIDRLLDPKAPGRGRALFLGVESGETATVSLQLPFRHRVVHHDAPYIRPLVAAYDEGRDAGILTVSRSGARLLEWSVGEAEELVVQIFEVPEDQLGREMTGPSPATPGDRRQGNVHRERFEGRVDANRQRFLREVTAHALQEAAARKWDRLVLAGGPKSRSAARELLGAPDGLRVIVADQSWKDTPAHDIADQVWPLLRSVHLDRERELIGLTTDRALSGGAGALGLHDVCDALNAGRVDHLLYDDDLSPRGLRSEEGTVHPDSQDVMGQAEVPMHEEPLLIERMIEKAIGTSAGVTPIGPDAADGLVPYGGVGALLRW